MHSRDRRTPAGPQPRRGAVALTTAVLLAGPLALLAALIAVPPAEAAAFRTDASPSAAASTGSTGSTGSTSSPGSTGSTGSTGATGSAATPGATGAQPIDFVVLVDESGSIGASIADERAAAALLTESEISPSSRAAVIGFGSSNAPGQSAVDPACPLTVIDAAGRSQLSSCVGRLAARTQQQGWDTDFNSAISQALATLSADTAQVPKLIFMLTDGQFDVRNSPQYGSNPTDRQNNGAKALAETLKSAAGQGVELWPLGFGGEVDGTELAALAAGGYQPQGSCSVHPAAHTVSSSSVVFATLLDAFAGARCGNSSITPGQAPGSSQKLTVTIPVTASEGSIVVLKRNPAAVVTFRDPDGKAVTGQSSPDGSTYEISGQNSPVQSLRITDPEPGTWTVELSDGSGKSGPPVMAAVLWQGTLRSYITMTPPAPHPGERVVVRVRLQTHRGVLLHTADQLAGISVSATLSGSGLPGLTVPLADDGAAPDKTATDGEFAGYLTVPAAASGALTLVGDVTGKGLVGDQRPVYFDVLAKAPLLTGTATIDMHRINPGGSVSGTLVVRNADAKAHTVEFQLSQLGPGEQARVIPPMVTVPAASQQQIAFTVVFAASTPLGYQTGVVTAADTTAGVPVDTALIDVQIVALPDFWQQWKLRIFALAVAALLLACALSALIARRRRGLLVGPLQLQPLSAAGVAGSPLKVQRRQTEVGFTVSVSDGTPALRRQSKGRRWTVRRERPRGGLQLVAPDGRTTALPPNRPVPLEDGLEIELVERGPNRPPPSEDRRTKVKIKSGKTATPGPVDPGSGWDDEY